MYGARSFSVTDMSTPFMPPSGAFSARMRTPALQPSTHFTFANNCRFWNSLPSTSSQPPVASLGLPTISPFSTFQSA